MSRSGYLEDCDDQWRIIRWRGAVQRAIKGKRGQAFLKEMLAALDAIPERKLIAKDLEIGGAVCALGAVGKARGINMSVLDPACIEQVAATFGVSEAMAREIVFVNDEDGPHRESAEDRYARVRSWIEAWIIREG